MRNQLQLHILTFKKEFLTKKYGGVSKSMLALNESIIDIKEH